MLNKNPFDWPSAAELAAERWQEKCIESVSDNIIFDLTYQNIDEDDYDILEYINHFISNACIYTGDCQEIINDLGYDIFAEDPIRCVRASNWMTAAIWALEEAIFNTDIEKQIKEKIKDGAKKISRAE